jgi:precorrin-6B methylase 2
MRARIRWLYNTVMDRILRVSTVEGPVANSGQESFQCDQHTYLPTDYLAIAYLFAPIAFGPQDVFVDIGCGLGRAVLMAARRPIRRAIGIEFDPPLALVAEQNARHLRGARAPIEIRNQDATDADYTEGTIFWMYHPFGKATMQIVLERLHQSLGSSPRRILIAYVNPELASQLDAQGWLRRVGERRFPGAHESGYAIYWEAGAPALNRIGTLGRG